MKIHIKVWQSSDRTEAFEVQSGQTLREVLLAHHCSPYRGKFKRMNCKGLGVCGSCAVGVKEAQVFWPRRSCQVRCYENLEVKLL